MERNSGTEYSNIAALTFITYPELHFPPQISGLDSNYAATVASDRIRILNKPIAQWRTQTIVMLDGQTQLAVAADSTFTIHPASYAPGMHYLRIQFRHPLDSVAMQVRFNVLPGVETQAVAKLEAPEKRENLTLKAYPNPFAGQLNVQGLDADRRYQLTLHNTAGQPLFSKTIYGQQTAAMNGGNLPPGMYFLQVYDVAAGKTVATLQVVKQ